MKNPNKRHTTEAIMRAAIDLFCGAGGVSLGFDWAGIRVVQCVNHDYDAIRFHAINNPNSRHFIEDVKRLNRRLLFKGVAILWASLECTHHSRAKGGQSRDADSRSLAWDMLEYLQHCDPAYFIVENVVEFLSWGELKQKVDSKGRLVFREDGTPHMVPVTDKQGRGKYYREWVAAIEAMGYTYEYRILNFADYGVPQARVRYIGVFAKKGLPITFPAKTHNENGSDGLLRHVPVSTCLNLKKQGRSVFSRKTPLAESTTQKLIRGLKKYKKDGHFLVKYYSTGDNTRSIHLPSPTATTKDFAAIASIVPGEFHDFPARKKDPESLAELKALCRELGIADINYRVLDWQEVRAIMGFPESYVLSNRKGKNMKFLGNAVPPQIAMLLGQEVIKNLDRFEKEIAAGFAA